MVKLFDLEDKSDLPSSLVKELSRIQTSSFVQRMENLFSKSDSTLTAKQLCVAYYREYGEERDLQFFSTGMSRLIRSGKPYKRVDNATWSII